MAEFNFTDKQYDAATKRGEEDRAASPAPASVRYDRPSGRIIVEFTNGSAFMTPARALQGLENATDAELEDVHFLGQTGLHWESLDVDFTINGLMRGIFGTEKFMAARRRGGQARSEAKIAASRANGAKGGRPKKVRP